MKRLFIFRNTTTAKILDLKVLPELQNLCGSAIRILFFAIFLSITSSCTDFLDQGPLNVPDETTFWKNEDDAQLALNNLYTFLPDANSWWTECYSDNAIMTNAWGEGGLGEIKQGGLAASTAHIQSAYKWSQWRYDHIRQILYFVDNVKKVNFSSEMTKKRIEGEARFILALKYFRISRLWGDVPLIKEMPISLEDSRSLTRSSQKEVFSYVLENVDKAIEFLPNTNDNTGKITRNAAYMLKAEVLMWMASTGQFHNRQLSTKTSSQLWREAANSVQKVIKSGNYSLYSDIITLFQSSTNNKDNETILARQYVKDEITNMTNLLGVGGGVSLRGGGWASFSAPRDLVDDYECLDGKSIFESSSYDKKNPWKNRDLRLTSWFLLPKYPVLRQDGKFTLFESHPSYAATNREAVGGEGGGGRSGYWGVKYVEMDSYIQYGHQNWIIYRYGEALLMLAESLNECEPGNDSIVWSTNMIRTRAGLPGVDALKGKQQEMRFKIWHERRVELVNEEKRYYDLLRTKQAEVAMNPPGNKVYGINLTREDYDNAVGDWTKEKIIAEPIKFDAVKGYLWPIPQDVIDKNKNITQNPGW